MNNAFSFVEAGEETNGSLMGLMGLGSTVEMQRAKTPASKTTGNEGCCGLGGEDWWCFISELRLFSFRYYKGPS